MSKNLEKEYRALVDSEAPDLWSRIEAGLEGKTAAGSPVSISDAGAELTGPRMTDLHGRWHPRKSSPRVWAGLAAACVCVALIIPAMVRTMRMGNSSSSGSSDSAAPQNLAPPVESYDMAEGAYGNGAYIDGAAGSSEEAAHEDRIAGDTVGDSGTASSTASGNIYVSLNADTDAGSAVDPGLNTDTTAAAVDPDAGSAAAPAGAAEEEKDTYHFAVTVEILDADVGRDSGILYTAKVVASDNPAIQADSEIKIFDPALPPEGAALGNAETYKLILREKDPDDPRQDMTYVIVEE